MLSDGDLQALDKDRTKFLKKNKVRFFGRGLSDEDISEAEFIVGQRFPEDFRLFLTRLEDPNRVFFDWEDVSFASYLASYAEIIGGILFDVEVGSLWLERWNDKPQDTDKRRRLVEADVKTWPKLVPVRGHRYLAIESSGAECPVFSISQSDIICYGSTLIDYIYNDFILYSDDPQKRSWRDTSNASYVPVWSDFANDNLEIYSKLHPPEWLRDTK
jgi:hypothetical protein